MTKSVTVKVFHPGNKKFERQVLHAPPRRLFTGDGVNQILLRTINKIEEKFPSEDYRMVPIGPAAFNFVHAGPKEHAAAS